FPSADQARTFLNTSADRWSRCGGQTFSISSSTGDERWTVGDVTRTDLEVMQRATAEAEGGYACQHVVRAVSNVVIEALACHDNVADEADRIADDIADNMPE
ncbi:sensor domain-containing protein, partial [Mycobacterium sp. ITM-2017-0098]